MLPSITSDNSKLPEAFIANIIKSFLFISVTQATLKKQKRPRVSGRPLSAAHDFCFQMLPCAIIRSLKCISVVSRCSSVSNHPHQERCD